MPTCLSVWRLIVSIGLCALWTEVRAQTCTKINACSCSYGANQVVDLSPLQGNPKWSDQYDPQYVNMYSYNPCQAFTEGSCNNVAVCQFNGADYYECGTQDSATFTNDPTTGDLTVSYSSTDGTGFVRTSLVTLQCIQSGPDTLTVNGETGQGTYIFVLSSVHCCPKGAAPSNGGGSSGGLSIGSILVIAFFALIIIYFAFGVVIQRYARQASGKEMLPNHSFWIALPGLVKDGTLFVVRRGKGRGGYSDI